MDDNQPQELDYLKDVHTPPMRDIVTPEPAEPVKEPEKPIETAVETPVETPTTPTPEEIAKATADEIEARQAAETPQTPQEDEYAKWEQALWETENRTPTYQEALDFMRVQSAKDPETIKAIREAIKAEEDAEKEIKAEEDKIKAEEVKKTDEQLGKMVDDELNELYQAGILTKIQDPKNEGDQGVVEKKSLFARWLEVNNERAAKGLPQITSAVRIAHYYWQKPNAQPAGFDAPVMGNRSSVVPPAGENDYSYNEVHRTPWNIFKRRG